MSNPLIVNPVTLSRGGYAPFPDASPFTVRSGITYAALLEEVRSYLRDTVNPFIENDTAQAIWDDNADILTDRVNAAIVNAMTYFNAATPWIAAGIKADGVTDDSTALKAFIAGLTEPTILELPAARQINIGSAIINIDASKLSLKGHATQIVGTGSINISSTVDYYGNQYNWKTISEGIVFRGVAINIGHPDRVTSGKFKFRDGGVLDGSLNFLQHAWKIAFDHFHLQGAPLKALSGDVANDRGENMVFTDCMISDASDMTFAQNGDWHFIGCSLDNIRIDVSGNSRVNFSNCHFEMRAGDDNSRSFLRVIDGISAVTIRDSELVINPNGSAEFQQPPFYVAEAVGGGGGILIDGFSFPSQPYIKPEIGWGTRMLVGGRGPARVSRVGSYTNAWQYGMALSYSENRIYNGDAEKGSQTGWNVTPTNGAYILDSTYKNKDGSSHKIQAVAGAGSTFWQEFTVVAGRNLWGSMWRSFNGSAGAKLNTQLEYFNRNGDKIATARYDQMTSGGVGHWRTWDLVPNGAVSARLTFYLDNTAGSALATMNIDDVVINID